MPRVNKDLQTNINRLVKYTHRHATLTGIFTYFALTLVVTAIIFWRFPNNVIHANFYAEDGSIFLQNIMNKGWVAAVFTAFNGYFVVGIYMLCGFGWILNSIFGGLGLISLSSYFALASIIFMAAVICLPFLLFRNIFGVRKTLAIIAFSALLPLPLSPHIVIGTVGNQKWIFMYLAFLLCLYRVCRAGKLKPRTFIAIDLGILISAYTNSTVYFLFPMLLIPYFHKAWQGKKKNGGLIASLWLQVKQKEVLSSIVLAVALLPQVVYVLLNGIPKLPGYLDSPFHFNRFIEVFINRTYLFGVTHIINGHLSDLLVVVLFIVLLVLGWRTTQGKEKIAFWAGIYAAGVASLLFVFNRPGVSDFFFGYTPSGSGPDQFFYAQTLIMYTPFVLVAFATARRLPKKWLGTAGISLFCAAVIAAGLYSNSIYGARWRNASQFENATGTFIDQALSSCANNSSKDLSVPAYPFLEANFSVHANRTEICKQNLYDFQYSSESLGLVPYNNNYESLQVSNQFYQTFTSNENGLNGVRLFISTFNNGRRTGDYKLVLYDGTCQHALRSAHIPNVLLDNTFYNARFTPINGSSHKQFCFSIVKALGEFNPIAIQKSKTDVYKEGQFTDNGQPSGQDVVFEPLYTQHKP